MVHGAPDSPDSQDETSGGSFSGHVELDETFIGGKARNMHFDKWKRMGITKGRSMAGKVALMGLLGRTSAKGKSRVRVARGKADGGIWASDT